MKITATIITLNEERNIARAIESLRCCDEILMVDSGSSDRTLELAQKLGVRVIEAPWQGYAKQKNLAAEQASHDWILSIDADEALSEGLEGEIWNLKKNGADCDGYTMPRLAQYLGRWIFHGGWYPDRKVRLYHRAKARWTGPTPSPGARTCRRRCASARIASSPATSASSRRRWPRWSRRGSRSGSSATLCVGTFWLRATISSAASVVYRSIVLKCSERDSHV